MRMIAMLATGAALMTAGSADAQRMVQHGPGAPYPMPGPNMPHPMTMPPQMHPGVNMPVPPAPPMRMRRPQGSSSRWGSQIGGHWWGGMNAPGGWAGYRRPYRGYRVPTYWSAPRFYVSDWGYYGLPAPTAGYSWARYYDDAVLIDGRGSVYDTRSGLDWDRDDDAYDGSYDRRGGVSGGSGGVGGAVAGAVVGGVAGNVIGGRGNRLEGTLIGAGVGAAAGYAIDRGHDRGRDHDGPPPPLPAPGYDDEPPMAPDHMPPPRAYDHGERRVIIHRDMHRDGGDYPPPGYPGGPGDWRSPDGRTTVTTTTGGGYGGYGASGPVIVTPGYGVTTVTVQTQPIVTTTTTEIVEDSVTWTRPVVRKVYRHRVWRPRTKILHRARCACGS